MTTLPADHAERLERARLSLDGLSLGDAFGDQYFVEPARAVALIANRAVPGGRFWHYTDDTEMAVAIYDVLAARGSIDRDLLARAFARRYVRDPARGYGPAAHGLLASLGQGVPWPDAAGSLFHGMGSMGNGGAMRVAPLGAYFADDLDALREQAVYSAEVTHKHPEGKAGAVAIALAAAFAWRHRTLPPSPDEGRELLDFVLEYTPDGDTRAGIAQARALPADATVPLAASALGSGWKVTAPDTVPFSLWCAARHLRDYEEALWFTLEGLGDRDTTCAIVGGIVALAAGRDALPPAWLACREPLAFDPELT